MKQKKDPVVEKLDEILKTLRRIEAKPVGAPVPIPFYFYPPYIVQPAPQPVYPIYPQITWANPSITICDTPVNGNGGSWASSGPTSITVYASGGN